MNNIILFFVIIRLGFFLIIEIFVYAYNGCSASRYFLSCCGFVREQNLSKYNEQNKNELWWYTVERYLCKKRVFCDVEIFSNIPHCRYYNQIAGDRVCFPIYMIFTVFIYCYLRNDCSQ
jgi:hypothetical protein